MKKIKNMVFTRLDDLVNHQDGSHQESGVIIYEDNVVIITNWSATWKKGLPRVSPIGVDFIWGIDDELKIIDSYRVDDCLSLIPETDALYLSNEDDIKNLKRRKGTVFDVLSSTGDKVKVIKPDDWI